MPQERHQGIQRVSGPKVSDLSKLKPPKECLYQSLEEAACSSVLSRFLNWEAKLGTTYQRPISDKHDADFYLPKQNIILEYHPPVIKWYGAKGTFQRLNRLKQSLKGSDYQEVQDLLCAQISHEYYKRRRGIMDDSSLPGVKKMRLVVCEDSSQVYQMIVRPYSKPRIPYQKFKEVWDQTINKERRRHGRR